MPDRKSSKLMIAMTEGPWRSIIRLFAILMAILGLVLVIHEIWENVMCPAVAINGVITARATYCAKIHLSSMLWGVALTSLGMLIIQKGDVSESLSDFAKTGTVVRSWWPGGRRSTDQPVVVEQPVVEKKDDANPVPGT